FKAQQTSKTPLSRVCEVRVGVIPFHYLVARNQRRCGRCVPLRTTASHSLNKERRCLPPSLHAIGGPGPVLGGIESSAAVFGQCFAEREPWRPLRRVARSGVEVGELAGTLEIRP